MYEQYEQFEQFEQYEHPEVKQTLNYWQYISINSPLTQIANDQLINVQMYSFN